MTPLAFGGKLVCLSIRCCAMLRCAAVISIRSATRRAFDKRCFRFAPTPSGPIPRASIMPLKPRTNGTAATMGACGAQPSGHG